MTNTSLRKLLLWSASLALGAALASATLGNPGSVAARDAAPKSKTPTTKMQTPRGKEIATLAAGCFWSMEAIFEQLKGVESVEPGYAGGNVANPSYEQVCSETTGHAETVNIIFDPKQISYSELLKIMLTMRDPTTLNRQGPDAGESYRSVIWTHGKKQQETAQKMLKEIAESKIWSAPLVTPATPFLNFYRAEDYHRDYYRLHPNVGYSQMVIAPEIADLHEKFPADLKS
jgi:peptide-methionine (S)-S-oxide reductase